jgi:hypothetical protein
MDTNGDAGRAELHTRAASEVNEVTGRGLNVERLHVSPSGHASAQVSGGVALGTQGLQAVMGSCPEC